MFRDRQDAGQKLAAALEAYRQEDPLILAIPRGGVEVGYHVATRLDAQLVALVVRKLPLPRNPEAGFGAVAEDGSTFMFEHMAAALSPEVVEQIVHAQKEEIRRRVEVLREGQPLPEIAGRTAILVDDGIAMGSTVRAGIAMCRNEKAGKIIVGAPVASPSTADELAELVDDVVIIEQPPLFRAVAQVYENWYDVADEEVVDFMHEFAQQHA
jgi:predicted phosphoribosyltransferase